jgi:hypothetical protein
MEPTFWPAIAKFASFIPHPLQIIPEGFFFVTNEALQIVGGNGNCTNA